MGRPLNSKFFGALAQAGFQVGCSADLGSGSEPCRVIKQKSNRKYLVADAATGVTRRICKTVSSITGPGEMTVEVTPENAAAVAPASFTFNRTALGAVTTVAIVSGGYGYWTGGTFNITVASDGGYVAGTEAVVTYTVSGGRIVSASVTTPGAGYTAVANAAVAVAAGDLPATTANPPVEYAKVIRNNHVVTFGNNRYVWPATGGAGPGPSGLPEAALQGS
jgi:hypothetical protein